MAGPRFPDMVFGHADKLRALDTALEHFRRAQNELDAIRKFSFCVFRSIPASDSGGKPATDSGRSRPPIPVEVGRLIRWHPGHFGRCCRNGTADFP